jgi:hypothetical protein
VACSSAPAASPAGDGDPVQDVSGETAVDDGTELTGQTSIASTETTKTTPAIPALPVITLTHEGTEYIGAEGSYCWPVEMDGDALVGMCADKALSGYEMAAILADPNDSIILNVEAHEFFTEMTVTFSVKDAAQRAVKTHRVRGFGDRISLDLPAGSYTVRAMGFWAEGDISYEFNLTVRDTGEPVADEDPVNAEDEYEIENHSLLQIADVNAVANGEAVTGVARDLKAAADAIPSSKVEDVVAWIAVQFDDEDAARQVLYSEIHFVSAEEAGEWMDTVEAEFQGEGQSLGFGDRSVGFDALAEGAGAFAAWVDGPRGYMIVSAMQPGADPLVDYAGLLDLADVVLSRGN